MYTTIEIYSVEPFNGYGKKIVFRGFERRSINLKYFQNVGL